MGHELKKLQRKWGLKHAYGILPEQYDQMSLDQGGVCAICRKPETATFKGHTKRLSVDHDHGTGRVRGLLCTACNTLLGHARDNVEVLREAIVYLFKHTPKPSETQLDVGHEGSV